MKAMSLILPFHLLEIPSSPVSFSLSWLLKEMRNNFHLEKTQDNKTPAQLITAEAEETELKGGSC